MRDLGPVSLVGCAARFSSAVSAAWLLFKRGRKSMGAGDLLLALKCDKKRIDVAMLNVAGERWGMRGRAGK